MVHLGLGPFCPDVTRKNGKIGLLKSYQHNQLVYFLFINCYSLLF